MCSLKSSKMWTFSTQTKGKSKMLRVLWNQDIRTRWIVDKFVYLCFIWCTALGWFSVRAMIKQLVRCSRTFACFWWKDENVPFNRKKNQSWTALRHEHLRSPSVFAKIIFPQFLKIVYRCPTQSFCKNPSRPTLTTNSRKSLTRSKVPKVYHSR